MNFLRRFLKFLVFFGISYILIFVLFVYMSPANNDVPLKEIIAMRFGLKSVVIIFVFSIIYPLLGFAKIRLYINGNWSANEEWIVPIIEECGYVKEQEDDKEIMYRKKNKFMRAINLGEDHLILDKTDNPLEFYGMRKEVKRLKQRLDIAKELR